MIPLTTEERAEYAKRIGVRANIRFDCGVVSTRWNTKEEWDDYGSISHLTITDDGRIAAESGFDGVYVTKPIANPYIEEYRDIDFLAVPYDDESKFLFEVATSPDGTTWGDYAALTRKVLTWTASNQISALALTGWTRANSAGGRVFFQIKAMEYQGQTVYVFDVYASPGAVVDIDAPSADLIARGTAIANAPGVVSLSAYGGSGVSGSFYFEGYTEDEEIGVTVGWSIREIAPAEFTRIRITIFENTDQNYLGSFYFNFKLDFDFSAFITNVGALTQTLTQTDLNNFKNANISLELSASREDLVRIERILMASIDNDVYTDVYAGFAGWDHLLFRGIMQDRSLTADFKNNKTTITLLDYTDLLRRRTADVDLKDSESNWITNRTVKNIVAFALNKAGIYDHSLIKAQMLGTGYDLREYGTSGVNPVEAWDVGSRVYLLETRTSGGYRTLVLKEWVKDLYDENNDIIVNRTWNIEGTDQVVDPALDSVKLIQKTPTEGFGDLEPYDCYYIYSTAYVSPTQRMDRIRVIFINRETGDVVTKIIGVSDYKTYTTCGLSFYDMGGGWFRFSVLLVGRASGTTNYMEAWGGNTAQAGGSEILRFSLSGSAQFFINSGNAKISAESGGYSRGVGGAAKGFSIDNTPSAICVAAMKGTLTNNKQANIGFVFFGKRSETGPWSIGWGTFGIVNCAYDMALTSASGGSINYCKTRQFVLTSGGNIFVVFRYKRLNVSEYYEAVASFTGKTNWPNTSYSVGTRHAEVSIGSMGAASAFMIENGGDVSVEGGRDYTYLIKAATPTEYWKLERTALTKIDTIGVPTGNFISLFFGPPPGTREGNPISLYVSCIDIGGTLHYYFGYIGTTELVIPSSSVFAGKSMFDVLSILASGYNFYFGVSQGRVYFTDDINPTTFTLDARSIVKISDITLAYGSIYNVIEITYDSGAATYIKQSDESVSRFGIRKITLELPHLTTEAQCLIVADRYLSIWAFPFYTVSVEAIFSPHIGILDAINIDYPQLVFGTASRVIELGHDYRAKRTRMKLLMAESPEHSWYGISLYGSDSEYG